MDPVRAALSRNLIFIGGKGGVGKSTVAESVSRRLALGRKRTLWVTFEDPLRPAGEIRREAPDLWHLNCDAQAAFEEYVAMKIGVASLTRVFLRNQVMQYLAKAAPGIHELVLLGKVWFERKRYDHVVCDLPSTGYGLAMFQSARNFADLFQTGPLYRDAEAMLATFGNAAETGHLIVSLPEEMPIRESLDLDNYLRGLFPANPAAFLVNRRFPAPGGAASRNISDPDGWPTPMAWSALDYARKRAALEEFNLKVFREAQVKWADLPALPSANHAQLTRDLGEQLSARDLL